MHALIVGRDAVGLVLRVRDVVDGFLRGRLRRVQLGYEAFQACEMLRLVFVAHRGSSVEGCRGIVTAIKRLG